MRLTPFVVYCGVLGLALLAFGARLETPARRRRGARAGSPLMAAARAAEPPSAFVRRRDEFLGILLAAVGLLLVAALVSYHPNDPSLFSAVNDSGIRPRNWAGRGRRVVRGRQLQFFGLAAFVVPLALLAVGWSRFRGKAARGGRHEGPGPRDRRSDGRAARAPLVRQAAAVRRLARRGRLRGRPPRLGPRRGVETRPAPRFSSWPRS